VNRVDFHEYSLPFHRMLDEGDEYVQWSNRTDDRRVFCGNNFNR